MLQFVFKISPYMAPTCFGPFGPSSGCVRWNFAKVRNKNMNYKEKNRKGLMQEFELFCVERNAQCMSDCSADRITTEF